MSVYSFCRKNPQFVSEHKRIFKFSKHWVQTLFSSVLEINSTLDYGKPQRSLNITYLACKVLIIYRTFAYELRFFPPELNL